MVKRLRCPDCGGRTAHLFCMTETIIYCYSTSHIGFNAYKTAHLDSKDYGKEFEKVPWRYKCPDEINNNGVELNGELEKIV